MEKKREVTTMVILIYFSLLTREEKKRFLFTREWKRTDFFIGIPQFTILIKFNDKISAKKLSIIQERFQ